LRTILDKPAAPLHRPAPHAVPAEPGEHPAHTGDLVARALTILAEKPAARPQQPDQPLQRHLLSDGTECRLPIRYFDDQYFTATFLTDLNRTAELLKGTGLHAVPQEDGKAVVILVCCEYRSTDIGPYNEAGLAILSAAPGDPVPAIYIVNLPVTTAVAHRAGREIWGFNKFVAAIDIRRDGRKFSATIHDPEKATIATIEGRRAASVPVAPSDILTFSVREGKLIKTLIQVPTPLHVSSGGGFVLKVGTSGHPMAKNLRALGLDGECPVLVHYADPFQALLFPGRTL
jgi:hypothetical protein